MDKHLVQDNIIVKRTFGFSLLAITYVEELEAKRKFVIAKQLLKSATSIGANVREAQNTESKPDFIHKMKIAAKEAEETQYWLELCQQAKTYPSCPVLIEELNHISRILNRIIVSSKH